MSCHRLHGKNKPKKNHFLYKKLFLYELSLSHLSLPPPPPTQTHQAHYHFHVINHLLLSRETETGSLVGRKSMVGPKVSHLSMSCD